MNEDVYHEVDRYIEDLFGPPDPVLTAAQDRSTGAGLPDIALSPTLARFLHVLALAAGATSILEIGTLGGYSAIWLGRALPPDGRLVSLEIDPEHAEVARRNLAEAGLAEQADIRVGDALATLAELGREGAGPFDMVFIDADKPSYTAYLDAALRLARPGTVIVADNVVWRGEVASESDDETVAGLRRFNAALAEDPRLTGCLVQQVGVRGHDGMAIAVVTDADAG